MINISLGNWFMLVLVDIHFRNALKHGLQNLILIEILIKFPLNPHPKYTECFLVSSAKPGLVVRWYQNSELLGKPELLMLSIEETFVSALFSSPLHSQAQNRVTGIVLFYSQHYCTGIWSTSPCLWNSPSGPVCFSSFEGKHLPDTREDNWAHPDLSPALRVLQNPGLWQLVTVCV